MTDGRQSGEPPWLREQPLTTGWRVRTHESMSGIWASQALAAVTRIELDRRAIDAQLDLIEQAVDNFGEPFPDDALSDFRLGFSHLAQAMPVSGGPLRDERHLRLARDAFSRLTEHPAPARQRSAPDAADWE